MMKIETLTLYIAVQGQTCIYTYELFLTLCSLIELEFTLWKCFHNRISNSTLYELQ